MTAKCRICNEEISSNIIGKVRDVSIALGEQMLKHVGMRHIEFAKNLVILGRVFNGFLMMNNFEIRDKEVNQQCEDMRDQLVEEVMKYAPEIDNVEDEEEDEEGEELGTIQCPNCDASINLDEIFEDDDDDDDDDLELDEREGDEEETHEESDINKGITTNIVEGEIISVDGVKK